MKTLIKIIFCFVVIFNFCCSGKDTDQPNPQLVVEVISINAPSLKNAVVEVDTVQKAKVLVPPFYQSETEKRYPVVYFIHGYGDSYLADYGIFKAAYDEMVAGNIKEFFIVSVNSNCSMGGTFGVNSPITGNWENHITEEIIKAVDERYRTISGKESRGISGFSMGGFCALNLGLRNAEIYNLVYAISPGVFNETDFKGAYFLWQNGDGPFINAYGAAFSPTPDLKYPYAQKPVFNGTETDSLIIENWKNGFGYFDKKINTYLSKSSRLKSIALDYGTADYYPWIPRGCRYLKGVLEANNINNKEFIRNGGVHEVSITNIKAYMLPFFSENLSFE